ncbi:MAG: 50S ribosomal protein L18 [Firmicutes bacterium]|nr:50S ribosomal protein L18 [Bacillota bacterium]
MIKNESRNVVRERRHIRVRAKISGTAARPRLSVYRSNAHISAQLIDDVKGVTLVASSSVALKLKNGGNKAAATLVGADIGAKALAAGIKEVVFDRSGYIYHGRVQLLAEAARKAGLVF